jgi:hypothetical protein
LIGLLVGVFLGISLIIIILTVIKKLRDKKKFCFNKPTQPNVIDNYPSLEFSDRPPSYSRVMNRGENVNNEAQNIQNRIIEAPQSISNTNFEARNIPNTNFETQNRPEKSKNPQDGTHENKQDVSK